MTVETKIGAIIPVRLSSERLPGKAMEPICGRPVIYHLLDRVAACHYIRELRDIVVCTTAEKSDDPLVDSVTAYGASVYRGSTCDIIRRFHDAIELFGFDAVVQADGDDPLSATEYMNATMAAMLADPDVDIITVRGLPLGTATKSFRRRSMQKVFAHYGTESNDTGFIYYFTRSGLCVHREIESVDPAHRHDAARLTLDYPEDLMFFRRIFEKLYRPDTVFSLAEAVACLHAVPELVEINSKLNEAYWQRTRALARLEFTDTGGLRREIAV